MVNYHNIFEKLKNFIIVTDNKGKIKFVNKSVITSFGYTKNKLLNNNVKDIIFKNDKNSINFTSNLKNGETNVLKNIHKNGEVLTVSWTISIIPDNKDVVFTGIDITDYYNNIKKRENKFKSLFNFGKDAIYVHGYKNNIPTKFTEVNDAACKMLGYTRDELLNLSPSDIDAPEKHTEIIINSKELLKNKEKVFETIHITKKGEKIPVEISSKLYEENNDIKVVSIARDIRRRKENIRELNKTKNFLETVFEQSPIGKYIVSYPDKKIIYANKQAKKLFGSIKSSSFKIGASLEKLLKEKEWESYLPDGTKLKKDELLIFKALSGQKIENFRDRIEWEDGIYIERLSNASPIYNNDNEIIAGIVSTIDITGLIKTEKALEQTKNRFIQLADNIKEVFWLRDKNKILYINQAYEDIWGRSIESAYKNPGSFIKNIHPDDKQWVQNLYNEYINMKHENLDTEYRIIRPDNSIRWIHVKSFPVRNENNEIIRYAGIAEDITNRKKIEIDLKENKEKLEEALKNEQASKEELEASYEELETTQNELLLTNKQLEKALSEAQSANKLKQELLAIMSHELRTPLTGIIGFSKIIFEDMQSEKCKKCLIDCKIHKDHFEYLEYILKSGERLNEVLSNLLELSVLQSGEKLKLNFSSFSIKEMLDSILLLFKNRIKEKNNNVYYKIKCNDMIFSDQMRIQQILFNLIGNAIKFTKNGEIKISVNKDNDYYIFSIKDTGIGIEQDKQSIIFDIFKQIDSSLSREYQGAGIGLNVCKKFIEALNGEIWLKSKKNKGTTFYFKIPVQKEN